jgi:hypothetical protein
VNLFYRLLFATDRAEATIYLDTYIDEVYLGVGNFHPGPRSVLDLFLSLDSKDIDQIENLAIDSDIANYHESDEEAPTWGLWWTLAMNTADEYVFTNLQTLTIHRNPSHKSCNDSPYIDFYGDFILTELDSNPGEFQAWQMEISGCYWKRKTKVRPVPWDIPLHNKTTWEASFSRLWADLEKHKYKTPSMALKTVRLVTFGKGPDHWAGRLEFLTGKKFVQATGCIYEGHKDLDTLLDWKEADTDGSGWYGYLTVQLSEPEFDPLLVYLTQNACHCAIGHAHQAYYYDDEAFEGVDLQKVLVIVRDENRHGGRPPWY